MNKEIRKKIEIRVKEYLEKFLNKVIESDDYHGLLVDLAKEFTPEEWANKGLSIAMDLDEKLLIQLIVKLEGI